MTIVTVGSGRDHATLQLAENAKPADVNASGQMWDIEVYNDLEYSAGLIIAGSTTSASFHTRVRPAAGQGFADHADKATNPLKYDQSKGVGINLNDPYSRVLDITEAYAEFEGIQVKTNGAVEGSAVRIDGDAVKLHGIIFEQTANKAGILIAGMAGPELVNSLIIQSHEFMTGPSNAVGLSYATGARIIGNTFVRRSDATSEGTAIHRGSSSGTLVRNNAVFGYATAFNVNGGSWDAASGYNATDAGSAPGSNNQLSLTFTSQFESTTSTQDWRVKAGSALIGAGTRDQIYTGDLDILKRARSTTTPTIGAIEYIAANSGALRRARLALLNAHAPQGARYW